MGGAGITESVMLSCGTDSRLVRASAALELLAGLAVTMKYAPRAMRLPERAAANSVGRCMRAAAGNVARDITAKLVARREAPHTQPGVLDGQTLTALGTASVDYSAATTGFHTDAKAMCAFTAGNGRLVGTFHDEWPNKERIKV